MAMYEIVATTPEGLEQVLGRRHAWRPEEALDAFLDQLEPVGLKRTVPEEAVFLGEITLRPRRVLPAAPAEAPRHVGRSLAAQAAIRSRR